MGKNVGQQVGRSFHKLSAVRVAKCKDPGYLGDGGGLWLQVSPSGTKSWIFRFTLNGRAREMGLGALHTFTLADAREKAAACRRAVHDGIDPIEARNARLLADRAQSARTITFDEACERYIDVHRAGWRNLKHADQWTSTLATYASPHFGSLPVSAIDTALVMKAVQPIWNTKTETASRLRGRIESVIAWADKQTNSERLNPARWSGHLDKLLPRPEKVAKVEHHAALPYAAIGTFMRALRAEAGVTARAVELIVLTAARTSEVFNARQDEFDTGSCIWNVPSDRMKAGKAHRVPLSDSARRVVSTACAAHAGEYLFPGAKEGRPLSNMAGLKLLERMGYGDYTVHGFRSTFRDWAAEQTDFPREVAEAALAHQLKDKTEAAYQRSDLIEKRAKLMQAWDDFCSVPAAGVSPRTGKLAAASKRVAA